MACGAARVVCVCSRSFVRARRSHAQTTARETDIARVNATNKQHKLAALTVRFSGAQTRTGGGTLFRHAFWGGKYEFLK